MKTLDEACLWWRRRRRPLLLLPPLLPPASSEWLMRSAGQKDEVVFGFEMD